MKKPGLFMLLIAGVLFAAFFSNVALGALGQKPLLGDIPEMLVLFASSVFFAAAVLIFEADDS
ncbi:MAG: hypothetical protein ACR2OX_08260 [Methyloligellaceae bacterium]